MLLLYVVAGVVLFGLLCAASVRLNVVAVTVPRGSWESLRNSQSLPGGLDRSPLLSSLRLSLKSVISSALPSEGNEPRESPAET